MLIAHTEPLLYQDKIATKLLARVTFYDLRARRGEMFIKVSNETDGSYYTEYWSIPQSVLENWGTDDTILLQAFANEKGFIITSFEQ